MRRIFRTRLNVLAAVVVAALAISSFDNQVSAASEGFAVPEAAVKAYIDGVIKQDFNAILATTYVDVVSKKLDFPASIDRLRVLKSNSPVPPTSSILVEINKAHFTALFANQVKGLTYSLMTNYDSLNPVVMDSAGAKEFSRAVDTKRLAKLKLVKIANPADKLLKRDKYDANVAMQAASNGADGGGERVVLFTFEDKSYMIGFWLLRYGDKWLVASASSLLAGTSIYGEAKPITAEEFTKFE